MKQKRLIALVMAVLMMFALIAGCSNTDSSGDSSDSGTPASTAPSDSGSGDSSGGGSQLRVAMLLSGYINDAGWNQSSYEGMVQAQEE